MARYIPILQWYRIWLSIRVSICILVLSSIRWQPFRSEAANFSGGPTCVFPLAFFFSCKPFIQQCSISLSVWESLWLEYVPRCFVLGCEGSKASNDAKRDPLMYVIGCLYSEIYTTSNLTRMFILTLQVCRKCTEWRTLACCCAVDVASNELWAEFYVVSCFRRKVHSLLLNIFKSIPVTCNFTGNEVRIIFKLH